MSDSAYFFKKNNLKYSDCIYATASQIVANKQISYNKNKRFSRLDQAEHTQERKASFNRRWSKATKAVRAALEKTFTFRNLFNYIANPFATTSKDLAAKKNNIFNYYKYKNNSDLVKSALVCVSLFMGVSDVEYHWLVQESKRAYSKPPTVVTQITKRERSMEYEAEDQPQYTAIKQTHKSGAYQLWQPQPLKHETPEQVLTNVAQGVNTPEFQRFIALVGKDVARNYLKRILEAKAT